LNKVALFCLGLGLVRKENYSLKDKLLGFLILVPPIYLVLTPINAASAAVLSIGGYPSWNKAIIGLITVALAGWGVNALNHFIDRERDKVIWPERTLPTLASAIIAFVCALLLSWFFFNPQNFIILLIAIILGASYSAFFRNKVGYLSLPPVPGLIYLGGWAAFSPDTLFSTPLPLCLYMLGLLWQAAHITTYYPLHIVDNTRSKLSVDSVPPLLFSRPSPKAAAAFGLCFTCVTFSLSLSLFLLAPLGYLYMVFVAGSGIYTVIVGLKFLREPSNRRLGLRSFASLSIFRLVISVAMLLDVLVQYNLY
jgi:4-hydroxybenzoate polyprenyltransferase